MFKDFWKQIPLSLKLVWGAWLLAIFTVLGIIIALGLKLYMRM